MFITLFEDYSPDDRAVIDMPFGVSIYRWKISRFIDVSIIFSKNVYNAFFIDTYSYFVLFLYMSNFKYKTNKPSLFF